MAATDLREIALAAFFTLVDGVTAFETVARNPNWRITKPGTLPICAVYDGSESAELQDFAPPVLLVRMNVTVELWAIKASVAAALTELNRLRGLVRAAIGADPTLGGIISDVVYVGCDEPEPTDLEESPSEASMQLQFAILRLESAYNPDVYV